MRVLVEVVGYYDVANTNIRGYRRRYSYIYQHVYLKSAQKIARQIAYTIIRVVRHSY
jgi:hypothetical protein